MGANYRANERSFEHTPALDSEFFSVDATVELARFIIRGEVFETTERLATGLERTNRGFMWSISRSFGGLLPIVTATQRRGVIR